MLTKTDIARLKAEVMALQTVGDQGVTRYAAAAMVDGGGEADRQVILDDTRETLEALREISPKSLDLKELEIREKVASSAFKRTSSLHGWDGTRKSPINLAILSR